MNSSYRPGLKLKGKHAVITGGDSGIGRSVAIHFAKEGCASITILCLSQEKPDADETVRLAGLPFPQLCEEMFELERDKKIRLLNLAKEGTTAWVTLPPISDPKIDLKNSASFLEPEAKCAIRVLNIDLNQLDLIEDFIASNLKGIIASCYFRSSPQLYL